MYPNVRAEMARRGFTLADMSVLLDVCISTVSVKMKNGAFTLKEAVKIKRWLGVDMPLEVLFAEAR